MPLQMQCYFRITFRTCNRLYAHHDKLSLKRAIDINPKKLTRCTPPIYVQTTIKVSIKVLEFKPYDELSGNALRSASKYS